MNCPSCNSALAKRSGKTSDGRQKHVCLSCRRNYVKRLEIVHLNERMPWPAEYFSDMPFSRSPIVDVGIDRGQNRHTMPMKANA